MNRDGIVLVGFALALIAPTGLGAQRPDNRSEERLRETVLSAPTPAYPAALLAKRTSGVAVASVLVGISGKVEAVVVLEAPDPLMADAVRAAVQQWTFRPHMSGPSPDQSQPRDVASKLTFYFQIRNGAGVVLNPDEMPGGPQFVRAPRATGARPSGPPPPPPAARSAPDFSVLEIDKAEFDRRIASGAVVVDVRDRDAFRRGHHNGALNIPQDEIPIRASIEIPTGKPVIVDCSQVQDYVCMAGAGRLTTAQFRVGVFKK
jgi:TonB family protein